MTDLDNHARAAARAVRNLTAAPAPTAATIAPVRGRRRPIVTVAIAASVTLALTLGAVFVTRNRDDQPAADEVTAFCAEVESHAFDPSGVAKTLARLRRAPEEIHAVAAALANEMANEMAGQDGDIETLQQLSNQFGTWFAVRCYPEAAQPDALPEQRRFAPVPLPDWFEVCGVFAQLRHPPSSTDQYGTITIYGDTTVDDPYARPMIGLASSGEESFVDDDTRQPVDVIGHPDAMISEMTGPFGAPLLDVGPPLVGPPLRAGEADTNIRGAGQVISWRDADRTIGVFGRGYRADRTAELIAIAERVTVHATGPRLTISDRPSGFEQIFDGPLIATQLPFTVSEGPGVTYAVTGNLSVTTLHGRVEDPAAFEASRFFGTGLEPTTIAGRRALAGPLWATPRAGFEVPVVVAWRAPDNISLSIVSYPRNGAYQPTLAELRTFAADTRLLDRPEWESLIQSSRVCLNFAGGGSETRAGSEAGSGSRATLDPEIRSPDTAPEPVP